MSEATRERIMPIAARKFVDPIVTAKGERRAKVTLAALDTLWINTGTLCNLSCEHCYIESTPTNDRLAYITLDEVSGYLDEIATQKLGTKLIGFTGGEPFMNPAFMPILKETLSRGFDVIVLTNAMRPMMKVKAGLLALREAYSPKLVIRVSLDHYAREWHERERGKRSWKPSIDGLKWLTANGFTLHVAGRMFSGEPEPVMRAGFARLFAAESIAVNAADPVALVLFPEMDVNVDVPEITEACWGILHKSPGDVMCASSRMIVKRKGETRPAVIACTLLPYDQQFELGHTLAESKKEVALNHPHCAKFCVLGGASCGG
jgi:uncharacterized Fe-S cluster-containing radical SAM superfamily protein